MADQPTRLDLDEIAARASKATPGPWEEHDDYGPHFYAYLRGPYLRGVGTLNFGDGEDAAADREFVKHAREDVDALLAEVRHLRTQRRVLIAAMARKDARTGEGDRALADFLGSAPTEPSRHLEDGSTHTVQALTDAGEECVQQRCLAARQEAQLRQEAYTLRAAVEAVLDEVRDMADDEQLSVEAAGVLRERLRSALGLDGIAAEATRAAAVPAVETGR